MYSFTSFVFLGRHIECVIRESNQKKEFNYLDSRVRRCTPPENDNVGNGLLRADANRSDDEEGSDDKIVLKRVWALFKTS